MTPVFDTTNPIAYSFKLNAHISITKIETIGEIKCSTELYYYENNILSKTIRIYNVNSAVNTTVDNAFDITAKYNNPASTRGSSVTTNQFYLTRTY